MKKKISFILALIFIFAAGFAVGFFTDENGFTPPDLTEIFAGDDGFGSFDKDSEDASREYCRNILEQLKTGKTEFKLKNYDDSFSSLLNEEYNRFLDSNPEIISFRTYKIYSTDYIFRTEYEIKFETVATEEDIKRMNEEADRIVSLVDKNLSDYEKAIFLHDYIIKNCVYDNALADKMVAKSESLTDEEWIETTAYGCLIGRKTVCSGYAKTYMILLNKLGIECSYVTGFHEDSGHAWNCVKLDGDYYNIDVTWDDPDDEENPDKVKYTYFGFTDKDNDRMEARGFSEISEHPECTAVKYNYYIYNGFFVGDYSYKKAEEIIKNQVVSEKIILKFSSEEETDKAVAELMDEKRIFDIIENTKVSYISSGSVLTITLKED